MVKSILLIGKTGSGKSTLANVITNTNEFKEGSGGVSETREIQNEKFENNNIEYQIIDTVGIGDTNLSDNEVLDKIAEAVYLAREGIHQIFFVIRNRLDFQQSIIYNILKTIIFDQKSTNFTTIIRTDFINFDDKDKIKEDIFLMINSEDKISEIVKECDSRFVYVNNSTLNISCDNCEKNNSCRRCSLKIKSSERNRENSKTELLNCLDNYKDLEIYIPEKLKSLSSEISSYMKDKLAKRDELRNNEKVKEFELKRKNTEIVINNPEINIEKDNQSLDLWEFEDLGNDLDVKIIQSKEKMKLKVKKYFFYLKNIFKRIKFSNEDNLNYSLDSYDSQNTLIFEIKDKNSNNNKNLILRNEIIIAKVIKDLKDWREVKLVKEEIIKLGEQIRAKIRTHILNNEEEIREMIGGNHLIKLVNEPNFKEECINQLSTNKKKYEEQLDSTGKQDLTFLEIDNEVKKTENQLLNVRIYQFEVDKELSKEWKNANFKLEEIIELVNSLKENFDPKEDLGLFIWLQSDVKRFAFTDLINLNYSIIEKLKEEYLNYSKQYLKKEEGVKKKLISYLNQVEQRYELVKFEITASSAYSEHLKLSILASEDDYLKLAQSSAYLAFSMEMETGFENKSSQSMFESAKSLAYSESLISSLLRSNEYSNKSATKLLSELAKDSLKCSDVKIIGLRVNSRIMFNLALILYENEEEGKNHEFITEMITGQHF